MRLALFTLALVVTITVSRPAAADTGGWDLGPDFTQVYTGVGLVGGLALAIPTVGGVVCLATDGRCPGWGATGMVLGGLALLGGAVAAANESYVEDFALGFVIAGAGVMVFSSFVLFTEPDESWVAVAPTVLPGTQSSASGLAVVGNW